VLGKKKNNFCSLLSYGVVKIPSAWLTVKLEVRLCMVLVVYILYWTWYIVFLSGGMWTEMIVMQGVFLQCPCCQFRASRGLPWDPRDSQWVAAASSAVMGKSTHSLRMLIPHRHGFQAAGTVVRLGKCWQGSVLWKVSIKHLRSVGFWEWSEFCLTVKLLSRSSVECLLS
jgi:hypothetical protein